MNESIVPIGVQLVPTDNRANDWWLIGPKNRVRIMRLEENGKASWILYSSMQRRICAYTLMSTALAHAYHSVKP